MIGLEVLRSTLDEIHESFFTTYNEWEIMSLFIKESSIPLPNILDTKAFHKGKFKAIHLVNQKDSQNKSNKQQANK